MTIPIWNLDDTGVCRSVAPDTAGSLAEAAETEPPNGVYLVARTYDGLQVLDLDGHMDRMERSARTLGRQLEIPRAAVRRRVRELADELASRRPLGQGAGGQGAGGELRFRLTAVLDEPRWYRLAAEPVRELPASLLEQGAVCCLSAGWERRDPTVKSTGWMATRRALQGDCYEHLLTRDDGTILEGATSNFYAVIGDRLRTAGEGVLEGMARRVVMEVAGRLAPPLPLDLRAPTVAELESGRVTEACISSATRGVVPVCRIGEVELGRPGPRTRALRAAYGEWLRDHLEPLVSR